ncbi:hypothetical protein FACS189425_10220 [Clostridia bacterium]|nr:hypothetical protein FACS189425_10220 [Clostridia bacterium]
MPVPTFASANVAVPRDTVGVSLFTTFVNASVPTAAVALVLPSYTLLDAVIAPPKVNARFATCAEYTVVIAPV